jgi:hypothetical protein
MAAALRQEDTPYASAAASTTIVSNALPEAALIGSSIVVWIAIGNVVTITNVTDNASQAYTFIGSYTDTATASFYALFLLPSNASATQLVVTATISASCSDRNIHVQEASGTNGGSPDTYNLPVHIVDPGTAANAISIALTTTGASALVLGMVSAITGAGAITAGTGFTSSVSWGAGAGFTHSLFESKVLSAAGSNPCTFTDATDGATSTYLGGAIVLDSASSPFTPFTKTQFFVTDTIVQQ